MPKRRKTKTKDEPQNGEENSDSNTKREEKSSGKSDDDAEESVDSELEQSLPMIPRVTQQGQADDKQTVQVNAVMAEKSEEQPTGLLAWAGIACTLFALACLCLCFASPYWFQAYPNSFNKFRNIGLWEVCFDDYQHHKDDSQETYSGCWWVFNPDPKYSKLKEWLLPREY